MNIQEKKLSFEFIFLAIFTIVFFANTFTSLKNVGISQDGASNLVYSLDFVKGNENLFGDIFNSVSVFNIKIPLIKQSQYEFTLTSLILLPVLLVGGFKVISVNIFFIFFTYIGMLCLYGIIKRFFDQKAAVITILLLSTSGLFTHYSRIAYDVTEPIINIFIWIAIYLVLLFKEREKSIYLYSAVFLFGLSFSFKLTILHRVLAIIPVIIIIRPKAAFIKKHSKKVLISICIFLMGSSIFIAANIASKFLPFRFAGETISGKGSVFNNIAERTGHLNQLVRDDQFYDTFPYSEEENIKSAFPKNFKITLFYILLLFSIAFMVLKRDRTMLLVTVFFCSMFFLLLLSTNSKRPIHLSMIYPYPSLVIAYALSGLSAVWKKRFMNLIPALLLLILLMCNTVISINMHKIFIKTGGRGIWSGYHDDLTEYLTGKNISNVLYLGWGLRETVYFLSKGKIKSVYGVDRNQDVLQELTVLENDNIKFDYYILNYMKGHEYVLSSFLKFAELSGKRVRLEKKFVNKIGDWNFSVYSLK